MRLMARLLDRVPPLRGESFSALLARGVLILVLFCLVLAIISLIPGVWTLPAARLCLLLALGLLVVGLITRALEVLLPPHQDWENR